MKTKYSINQTIFYVFNNYIAMTRVQWIKITVNNVYYYMTNDPDTDVPEENVFATQDECRAAIKCSIV